MREALDQWDFVNAAYLVTMVGLTVLIAWSWLAMRRAEERRDRSGRGRERDG